MTKPRNSKLTIEDQLADYTDRILAREVIKQDEATFAPDPDLRALEQTALYLKHSLSNDDPDEATIQRMHNNIIGQWQQEKSTGSEPFWQKWIAAFKPSEQKWRSQQSRQRLNLAISLVALIVLMLVGIPFMNITGSNQPGASGQSFNSIVLIVFGGLILLAVWLFRRKP